MRKVKPAEADDRGEVTITLEGVEYHLRPSHQAIKAIEAELRPLVELANAARSSSLTIEEAGFITAEMMKAYGRSHPDDPNVSSYTGANATRLEELIFEEGLAKVQIRLAVLLLAAMTGGVTALGELKTAKGSR